MSGLAQKLLTCCSAMGDVERCHKLTARHRTKYSNRKMVSTRTESYCENAIAESNKRQRKQSTRKVQNLMGAFQSSLSMQAAVTRRKDQAAAQSIAAARESLNDSDDYTSPHNEFDDILDEICAETEYVSDESEDEL